MSLPVPNWRDIRYLAAGTPVQREVYSVLTAHRLLERLREYDPVLVGTVPIGLQIEGSDLDIVCEVCDFDRFERDLRERFGDRPGFVGTRRIVGGRERAKANFECGGWPIEVFGQAVPTSRQNGFAHMTVEYRLLRLLGMRFEERVRDLKRMGVKTEPAFARILGLAGDPYEEMLALAPLSDEELRSRFAEGE